MIRKLVNKRNYKNIHTGVYYTKIKTKICVLVYFLVVLYINVNYLSKTYVFMCKCSISKTLFPRKYL